jgi:hypothetical protein
MKTYKSRSGKTSGVTGYEVGEDYIRVRFAGGQVYTYSHRSCGRTHVGNMIALAEAQKGLSTYISRHSPAYQ